MYEKGKANSTRLLELDLAEEIRCNVLLHSARYLQGVRTTGTINDTLSTLDMVL
jgi:hypothetical protein